MTSIHTADWIIHQATIDVIEANVRAGHLDAQETLLVEYRRHPRPRYSLITWLKRHRPHNPTTRVIPNR